MSVIQNTVNMEVAQALDLLGRVTTRILMALAMGALVEVLKVYPRELLPSIMV